MSKNISIKEIAELANVSVATISRVMNGNGGYSTETEQRVWDTIKKYNYQPNLVAKGLRTSKSPLIGILVPDIVNEYFGKLVLELQTLFFKEGYLTTICNANEDEKLEAKQVKALLAQNVSGLVMISGTEHHKELFNQIVPTIYIDRRPKSEDVQDSIVYVESDNVTGGYLATRELIEQGCSKIGFITDTMSESSKTARYEGYEKAMKESGLPIEDDRILRLESATIDEGFIALTKACSAQVELDGIVCVTDVIALGAMLAIKGAGLRVPEDVKITGYDGISATLLVKPAITTVVQDVSQIAQTAQELLMEMIRGGVIAEKHYRIPVRLSRRASTGR